MFTVKFKRGDVDVAAGAKTWESALKFVGEFCDRPLVYVCLVEGRGNQTVMTVTDDGWGAISDFRAWIFASHGYVPTLEMAPDQNAAQYARQ